MNYAVNVWTGININAIDKWISNVIYYFNCFKLTTPECISYYGIAKTHNADYTLKMMRVESALDYAKEIISWRNDLQIFWRITKMIVIIMGICSIQGM